VANIFVAASATWNGKALKKAKQDVGVFDKQVKKLGGTLAAAFSVRALTSFGKASVKMALQSQAEQERLANLLKVTTGARQQSIAVLNDQAIALEKIGVVTAGSITQTQSQLATFDLQLSTIEKLTPAILDYVTAEKGATASAADFKSMTNGLAQALNGNFASLTKTGFVLDDFTKKTIKEGTETERAAALVKVLNSTYKDFNKNLRQTNAGKMQVLANTANDVKVTIGTGILDALTLLSNDNTIDNLASSMQDFATATSEVIVGLGKVAEKLKVLNVPGIDGSFLRNIPGIGAALRTTEALRALGRSGVTQQDRGGQERTAGRINAQQRKLEAKAIKNSVALRKAENDQLKKKTAVDQLKDKFDLERIGITAALNAATDEEVKLRLRSQLAILDNNEALAKKLLAEMEAAEGLKKFTDELASSTDKFSTMVSKLVNEFMAMGLSLQEASAQAHMSARYQAQADAFAAGGSVSGMSIPSSIAPLNKIPSGAINPQQQFTNSAILADLLKPATVQQSQYIMDSMSARYQAQADAYFAKQQEITLTIDTANTGDRFNQLIAESIQAAAKTGLSLSPVGSLP
jgi:hypothetical protein